MDRLRAVPPTEIAQIPVVSRKDYSVGTETFLPSGEVRTMELVGSNVLKYRLEDGTDLVVRPSGTEPKVKIYVGISSFESEKACVEKAEELKKLLKAKVASIIG